CVTSTVLLSGCASDEPVAKAEKDYGQPVQGPALVRALPHEYPDFRLVWSKDPAVLAAIDESIAYFNKPSSKRWFDPPYRTADGEVSHDAQVRTLHTLRSVYVNAKDAAEFDAWIRRDFDVYKSVGYDSKSGEVLFTGYYTPIFDGSLTPTERFKYPLYKRPDDLVTDPITGEPKGRRTANGVEPYPTRAEIESQGLLKGLELLYLADPFEVYIVHVQGSARVRLPDGRELHLGYHGKTDRAYKSVGGALIEEGKLKKSELSLARLRQYFRDHPSELAVLNVNESYVFFQEGPPGPFGSIGAKVTPFHTIATDKSVFPRGGPTVAVTQLPKPGLGADFAYVDHTGLYLDQDTGGAIRSAGRADLYIGVGPDAERIAGHVKNEGRLFYLFAKPGAYAP
ncbi:MAG TPA: MltA domain-containing protein, partial [Planctomycetota bacterium]|nr:MltA domain-containing protein [Planctomycetota bacterium]